MIPILFQDDNFIIVEKPSGMLVHPSNEARHIKISLLKELKKQTGHYLYPIHRLDRPVSGAIVFGLNKESSSQLMQQWNTDLVTKEYRLLARRRIEEAGSFDFDLTNDRGIKQEASTLYWPLKLFTHFTYLKVQIKTGRRHQIRRHFARRCHNLVGDTKYGKGITNNYFRDEFNFHRIFLHSHILKFTHPRTNQEIAVVSELPGEMNHIIENLC